MADETQTETTKERKMSETSLADVIQLAKLMVTGRGEGVSDTAFLCYGLETDELVMGIDHVYR